jgi:hypothetical protein
MKTHSMAVGLLAAFALPAVHASEWSPVLPLGTKAQFQDTSIAYGFCLAQDEILKAISRLHPTLEPQAKLAAFRFAQKTGDSCQGVTDALRVYIDTLGAKQSPVQSWKSAKPQLDAKILIQHKTMTAAVADKAVAEKFITEVQDRANGHLDADILRTLISASTAYRSSPALEMTGGWTSDFRSKGHEKSAGVSVQLKMPLSWRGQDANAAHIVQKWTTEVGTGQGIAMVMLSIWPATKADLDETEGLLKAADPVEFAMGSLPPGAELVQARRITLLQKPALEMTYRMKAAQLDQAFDFLTIQYHGIARGGIVVVQGQVGGPVGQSDPGALFAHYKDVFKLVANSLTDLGKSY